MSYPQRLYSVRLFLSKQGTFTRIFDVIYEETPDPAFTGTGVSQLMTFFTAPFFIHSFSLKSDLIKITKI